MWALIESGKVSELTDVDPAGRFHPSLVWVKCGSTVKVGMVYVDGTFKAEVLPAPTREQVAADRLMAYADPINGSDRYFAEAVREQASGNVDAAEKAMTAGKARHLEIEAANPWPETKQ